MFQLFQFNPEGSLSKFYETVGGIFDPSSIGQHFGGCNNGNPPELYSSTNISEECL